MPYLVQNTCCWDCANATNPNNVCSWAWSLKPVEGWTAKPTTREGGYKSYLVIECPLFKRDAYAGGTKRLNDPLYAEFEKGIKENET